MNIVFIPGIFKGIWSRISSNNKIKEKEKNYKRKSVVIFKIILIKINNVIYKVIDTKRASLILLQRTILCNCITLLWRNRYQWNILEKFS